MLHRLLPLLLIVTVLSYILFNFQTIRRDLVYKLGIANDPTSSCCTEDQILSSDGSFDEKEGTAIFNNEPIDYPKTSLAYSYYQSINQPQDQVVLGTTNTSGQEKWIEVSLDEQRLRAWEGNVVVMEYPISGGKWAPTPKGTFYIWYKTRSQVMSGGSKDLGTYYYLPNVPHSMFFYKGYAIHGAYWHNNFGQPMSHGCVNEPLNYAAQIFEWAGPVVPAGQNVIRATAENPGTRVYVH
ncbi:MAG: L,D-transpeptidase [Candidatus Daviesbacteria bacterium]|nr:L,D-transpeptidase [Candidatus Daviesbacteria bacterium]